MTSGEEARPPTPSAVTPGKPNPGPVACHWSPDGSGQETTQTLPSLQTNDPGRRRSRRAGTHWHPRRGRRLPPVAAGAEPCAISEGTRLPPLADRSGTRPPATHHSRSGNQWAPKACMSRLRLVREDPSGSRSRRAASHSRHAGPRGAAAPSRDPASRRRSRALARASNLRGTKDARPRRD